MDSMTIGTVARLSNTPASTIRYYEAIGVLPRPVRVNGRRRYDASVLQDLRRVVFARRAGFALSEMRRLRRCAAAEQLVLWRELLRRKREEAEARLAAARTARDLLDQAAACDCASLFACQPKRDG
jgi:DNA-binding transcriptional MerR regulator